MTNLVIGCVSNYDWDKVKYWVNSLKKSGFDGDVAVVGTNLKKDFIDKLTSEGIIVSAYGKQNEKGDVENNSSMPPHVERFFFIWDYLCKNKEKYGWVLTTDTRDVIFQRDPTDIPYSSSMPELIVTTEGLAYEDEPWGNQNLYQAFGPFFHGHFKKEIISNVGVIMGSPEVMKGLMFMIFQMSLGRPIPIVDQAVFNVIIRTNPYNELTVFTGHDEAYGVNLGTTLAALEAGAGDIGAKMKTDSTMRDKYIRAYKQGQPIISKDRVCNSFEDPFAIVHQWDRVPAIAEIVQRKYGDE